MNSPITLSLWLGSFGDFPRSVAEDRIGDTRILTAWLGVDPDPDPVQFFGSAVIRGSELVEEHPSVSRQAAAEMHARLVAQARAQHAT